MNNTFFIKVQRKRNKSRKKRHIINRNVIENSSDENIISVHPNIYQTGQTCSKNSACVLESQIDISPERVIEEDKLTKNKSRTDILSWFELLELRGDSGDLLSFDSIYPQTLSDIDIEVKNNPLLANQYIHNIIRFYRYIEPLYTVPNDYMIRQYDLHEKMRMILVDWLIEVSLKFKLLPETLHLSVSCIDRFLATVKVHKKLLQLVGITALFIACKYEEVWAPEVRDFVYVSDKAFNREQILKMERSILNTLGFKLTIPTPYFFLQRYLQVIKADQDLSFLSQYLSELAIIDYFMLKYPGSLIAAAALFTANKCMLKIDCWSNSLETHTQYSVADLQSCSQILTKLHKKARTAIMQAVYKKFSGIKFNKVARIRYFKDLLSNRDNEKN